MTPDVRPWNRDTVREHELRGWSTRILCGLADQEDEDSGDFQSIEDFAVTRLGEPTRKTEDGTFIWENEYYQFTAKGEDFTLNVPEGSNDSIAAKYLLWDMSLLRDQPLTRAEFDKYYEEGAELAKPYVKTFEGRSKEELKQFVLDYCDGRLFTDHQAGSDVHLVFAVIGLGALSVRPADPEKGTEGDPAWEAYQKLPEVAGPPPKRGDPPKAPTAPEPPSKADYPPEPDPPSYKSFDNDVEARLVAQAAPAGDITTLGDLFHDESPAEAELEEYRYGIRKENALIKADWQRKVDEWEKAKAQIDQAYLLSMEQHLRDLRNHEKAVKAHAEELTEWEAGEPQYQEKLAAWERRKAIRHAAVAGFEATRLQNLGCVYEYMDKAAPRGVNGKPIFFSCRILNRSDWNRCAKAITRELERRENMEI